MNKARLKKVLAAVLVSLLALGGSAAAPVRAGDGVKDLSLSEAVEMALAASPQTELNRIALERAKLNKDQAKDQKKAIEGMEDLASFDNQQLKYMFPEMTDAEIAQMRAGAGSYEAALGKTVGLTAAEIGYNMQVRLAELQENGIKMEAEKAYYDLQQALDDLKLKQEALDRAARQFELAEASLKAGFIAPADRQGARLAANQAQMAYNSARRQAELKRIELNQIVGLPLDQELNLTTTVKFEPSAIDLTAELEEAYANDLQYVGALQQEFLTNLAFEEAKSFYTPNVTAYKKARWDYEEAVANREKAKNQLEINVRTAYNNLMEIEANYSLLQETVELYQEQVRVAELKFKTGMITQTQLRQVTAELENYQTQLNTVTHLHNLLLAQFRYNIYSASAPAGGSMPGA